MKEIPLKNGGATIVDDEDYEFYSQWTWYRSCHGYAERRSVNNGVRRRFFLHRLIAKTPDGLVTDHINGDVLDNRRSNLRACTHSQNIKNRKLTVGSKSGFKGVSWHKASGSWMARIRFDGNDVYLGCFENACEAALAYDDAARKYHGEFANTNFD